MPKPILIWGAPGSVEGSPDFASALARSGKNLGNMLIGHGVRTVLSPGPMLERQQVSGAEEAGERCSRIVVPAANFLWRGFDLGFMADFVERSGLPVTIIGVGAQTNDRSRPATVHPGTMRLMRLASERSPSIGVRGHYTAEVLASCGIHNVEVIGCPSIYASGRSQVVVDTGRLASPRRIAANASRPVAPHSFDPAALRSVENVILSYAMRHGATFVVQDEAAEMAVAEMGAPLHAAVAAHFASCPSEALTDYFGRRARWFASVEAWSAFACEQDLFLGSRFHGNLVALVHGIPALFVVHDSRTMELASLLNVPNIHVLDADAARLDGESLGRIVECLDFSGFERSYGVLLARYARFLSAHGLAHRLPSPESPVRGASDARA